MQNKPVFIFSAGPRAGSTLLQRLVTSSHEVLVWGESQGALTHLADSSMAFDYSLRPPKLHGKGEGGDGAAQFHAFISGGCDSGQWVANMNPPMPHIVKAYRILFENLYGIPARHHGYARWGIKEVRCNRPTLGMLRTLFPEGKFIYLIRDPIAALNSIKQRNFLFLDQRGRKVVHDPLMHFARNWAHLAKLFAAEKRGFLVRYEDLVSEGYALSGLSDYLEVMPFSATFIRDSRADWPALSPGQNLTAEEVARVLPVLSDAMKLWNYAET